MPGPIQAERFDEGGEAMGYHDTTAGNSGGAYWTGDVDIEPSSEGGYDVGWIAPGEWLRYSITAAYSGAYVLEARVAAPGDGGTFHVEAGGADVSGPLTIPDTGGSQTWATISAPVVLQEGPQMLRLVFDASGSCCMGALDWIRLRDPLAEPPPAPAPAVGPSIPGVLQAVDYDAGGEGVAYHDTTAGNSGGRYRSDDVDIEASTLGGYNVGWIADGEWLAYTLDVATAGSYQLQVRVASPYAIGRMHAVLGSASSPIVSIPNTGSWQAWTTVNVTVSAQQAGPQQLRLVFDTGGFNVADITATGP